MLITFDPINIALSFVVGVYFVFLLMIFFKSKNNLIKNSYSLVIIAILLWTIAMILYRSAPLESVLFWCKVLYVVVTFTASGFYIFSKIFPYGDLPSKKNIFISLLANVAIVTLVILPDFIIKDVNIRTGQEHEILWGSCYFLYALYISSFFGAGLYTLFRKFLNEKGRVKSQIKFVFWGYFIGSNLAMVTNLLMVWWGDFRLNWLGQILSIIMVALTVYAIITHRLMDIRFVMRRYSVYIFSMFLIIVPAMFVNYLVNSLELEFGALLDYLIIIMAIFMFPTIRDITYKFANQYFFSSLYDSKQVIAEISSKLRTTLNINRIYDFIYETLNKAMHIKSFGVLRFDEKKKIYTTQYNINFNIGRRVDFEENSLVQKKFIEQNKPFIVSEMKEYEEHPEVKDLFGLLHQMNVEILLPLNIKDKVVGLLALGAKESGDVYNDEDLQVLSIVAAQSAISIENALLYEETKSFGERMEEEVRKATKDLRKANERLKKLDAAKSEFISIASHQLRTPLTVIKGYISMMLEGSFGSLGEKVQEPMEKVYESNERLIHLVENLLNISRIESGRLKFSYKVMHLETMIESVVEELVATAEEKGIKLEFNRLKRDLPMVRIDTEKIRQVVMNLTDNAIKYTPKGKVVVKLRKKDDMILFSVTDKGLGISATDLPNLFKKFSRGTGAMLEHTEGTGLGLFVAKQMIEAHKGRVWAESKGEGKGATFSFTLPIYKKK